MINKQAFTLVELVVVILILGILAAVAAPKLLDTSDNAKENGLKRSLSVVRDAIERYAADNGGALPGADVLEATFKSDLQPYLRGDFPANIINGYSTVDMQSGGSPMSFGVGNFGWRYNVSTGQFMANLNGMSNDGVRRLWEL